MSRFVIIPCHGNTPDHYFVRDQSEEKKKVIEEYQQNKPTKPDAPDGSAEHLSFLEEMIRYYTFFPEGSTTFNTTEEAIITLNLPTDTTVSTSHGLCNEHATQYLRYRLLLLTNQR